VLQGGWSLGQGIENKDLGVKWMLYLYMLYIIYELDGYAIR